MGLLANPRSNHLTHLALLGTLLFFEFLTLAISAAFVDRGKSLYFGYYFDSAGLIVAASTLTLLATIAFLVFNTAGNLYKGLHNSMIVEIVVFNIMLALNLSGAAALSAKASQFDCSSRSCQLGNATLAFAWLSTITLLALLVFLGVWRHIHRNSRGETTIYKSSIKGHYVDGEFESRAETGMASLAHPATPVVTSRPATPVVVSEQSRV